MFLWVLIARWAYAEVKLSVPNLIPFIDYSLEQVQIPTHDQWPPKEEIMAYAQRAIDVFQAKIPTEQTQAKLDKPAAFGANLLNEQTQG